MSFWASPLIATDVSLTAGCSIPIGGEWRDENNSPPASGTSLRAVTMRHLIAVASVAAALTLLISQPVMARTTMHGGGQFVADHHRAVVSSRFALIADTRFANRSVPLDRFPRRFSAEPRHRFAGFDRFGPFSPLNPF